MSSYIGDGESELWRNELIDSDGEYELWRNEFIDKDRLSSCGDMTSFTCGFKVRCKRHTPLYFGANLLISP